MIHRHISNVNESQKHQDNLQSVSQVKILFYLYKVQNMEILAIHSLE
jgi:predicted DNA-binding ribbon-helix-helix protein